MANLRLAFRKISRASSSSDIHLLKSLGSNKLSCFIHDKGQFCLGKQQSSVLKIICTLQCGSNKSRALQRRHYHFCVKSNTISVHTGRAHQYSKSGYVVHSRPLSSDQYYTSPIIVGMQDIILNINSYTGLPWWATIMSTTVFLRLLITLPLARQQAVTLSKMELIQPIINEVVEALKHNITIKGKRANKPLEEVNREFRIEARLHVKDIYKREGCNPLKLYLLPWAQLPLWILISLALRNISGFFPRGVDQNGTSLCHPDLITGGFGWIVDLSSSDPYYILPLVIGLTNFLNIELNGLRRKDPSKRQIIITRVFRTLTIAMVFFASQVPTAMSLYWATSSSYGLIQNLCLMQPSVRRKLQIPKAPSESQTPMKDKMDILKSRFNVFMKIQRK